MPPDSPQPRARRLFIGLAVADEVARRLVARVGPTLADPRGEPLSGVRCYGAEDLHATLCFLGAHPEEARPALESALAEELRGLNAPELSVAGTGGFPSLGRPRVLWAGVDEDQEFAGRLAALRNRVWQAALGGGWRPPRAELARPFRPHVTLARVRSGAEPIPEAFAALAFSARWLPTEVTLFESRPDDRSGERYGALAAVPLVVRPG